MAIYWTLHHVMEKKRLNIQDVADQTMIHRNVISRIKNNQQTRVDIDIIERLCVGLEIEPNDLFCIKTENDTDK